jgi:hypothetical protein
VISFDIKIQEGNKYNATEKTNSEPQIHLEPLHVLHAILVLGVQAVQLHHPEHNEVLQPFLTKLNLLKFKTWKNGSFDRRELAFKDNPSIF